MSPSEIEEIRDFLKNQIYETRKSQSCSKDHFGIEPEDQVDAIDYANAIVSEEMNLRLRLRDQKKISEMKEAIKRIDDGTYGLCADCEDNIPSARLLVNPTARFCIECQSKGIRDQKFEREPRGSWDLNEFFDPLPGDSCQNYSMPRFSKES